MRIERLPVLILNPHSRCNCRCAMCDIWKTTETRELTEADLQAHLESIRRLRVQWVVFSGGEPMMHSHLWRLCELLRENKIRITLLSSGLLLSRHAAELVRHADDVIVSLDGPAEIHDSIRGVPQAFDSLAAGVRRIRGLRSGFPISARSTVQRGNFRHLSETVAAARAIGLDSISFLAADMESSAFNRPQGWTEEKQAQVALDATEVDLLEAEIESIIAGGECRGFVLESPAKLRRVVRHFRVHLRQAEPASPICNAPWTSAVVEADGAVKPCFFHPPIGHLSSGLPLDQILNGPQAVAFRQSLNVVRNPICQKCVCSLNWTGTARGSGGAKASSSDRAEEGSPA